MNFKLILCLALVLSGGLGLKAEDTNDFNNDTFDVVEELNASEIDEGISNYCSITNQNFKLSADAFAVRTPDLGWMIAEEYKRLKLTNGETRIASPFGSKEFVLASLSDATKVGEVKAQFVVFQDGKPKWRFDFIGFRDADADWIDEKTLKIVYWPGTRVRVTELINVETGKIIYRSADGIYDSLKNSLQLKK